MVQAGEWSWERAGAPSGGAVTALAVSPAFAQDATVFAATMGGLFRSRDAGRSWQRSGTGFTGLSLTAVAVSPTYAADGLVLVASLEGGLLRVTDDGAWRAADIQGPRVDISALALSPNFARDGVAFAATLASGVLLSRNRGASWEAATFGLLDLEVTALALSPAFTRDDTLFAATATGIFRSPNGGRAWRETGFPSDAPAVLCLAVSPDFAAEGILYAGTDGAGLFRSRDRGATWRPVAANLRDACINAVAFSPAFQDDHTMLLAGDAGIYVSRDGGETWAPCAEAPGALCLAVLPDFPAGGAVLVGLPGQGILRGEAALTQWHAANEGLHGRRLTSLAVSPDVEKDGVVAACGAGEGVVWSADGGLTWEEVAEGLPPSDAGALAIAQRAGGGVDIYAALPEGLWSFDPAQGRSAQAGDTPLRALAVSPAFVRDGTIIAADDDGGIWVYTKQDRRWQRAAMPWPRREILALALSPLFERDRQVFAALGHPDAPRVEVWQGAIPGGWEPVVAYDSALRQAALAVPVALPWDGTWYAAIGEQFYGPLRTGTAQRRKAHVPAGSAVTAERPAILALAALSGPQPGVLASTPRGLYLLHGAGLAWQPDAAQGAPGGVVALAAVPGTGDGAAYALQAGGVLWRRRRR
jgi:photosystem II stability/assembly factor-like uncharacterized protein